ncbi:plasmid pRiA4b ORF-3 family protein [Paeniglutamicibacter antarcticus]|uniref:Plasmid pRiA4b Orf3-like domain-containing protein n=1 Tax=Paeniglutamicibacter antarcticus TaxID=494023 RepID=A0ABP9TLD8_9MICC
MGKKNKNHPAKKSRKPKTGSHPGRLNDSSVPVSIGSFRAQKLLAPLTAGFVSWFEDSEGEPDEALACLQIAGVALGELLDATPMNNITSFAFGDVTAVLDSLGEELGEDVAVVAGALHLYLDFLFETDRWSGTVEDYEQVHALFGDEEISVPELPEIFIPEIPLAEELAAFEAMPLTAHVTALLAWLGAGRPVTSTGVLRLADIEQAAACVGVAAIGTRQRPATDQHAIPGLETPADDPSDGGPLKVRSMNDVPVLNELWAAMLEAGLLDVRSTKAVPGEVGRAWTEASDPVRLEAYRSLATGYLASLEEAVATTMMLGPSLWLMHKMVLTLGCGPTPLPVERIEMAGNSPKPGGDDDGFMLMAIAGTAMDHFRLMAELGLVRIDTHVTVPEHMVRSVEEVFAVDLWDDEGHFALGSRAEEAIGAQRTATHESDAPVYRLKVMLVGSKPPVWRRLLVPSDSRLDDLHRLIQMAFFWDDSHLHAFQKDGYRGTMYSCDPEGSGPWDDVHVHECGVVLSAVLGIEGDAIDYTYDFGDDWRHRVTLEKVLEANTNQLVPSCTAGRGMAPFEDAGGVWGWAEKIEAANDAQHPEHAQCRQWLGLEEGHVLDPKEFNKDEINEMLRILG